MMLIFADFGKCKSADPASPEAQALVKRLQAYISENYYHCTPEMLNALGAMYRAGGSFTKTLTTRAAKALPNLPRAPLMLIAGNTISKFTRAICLRLFRWK